ncbi:MAG: hypothetical protein WD597_11210, partial [Balneolaceae bacterium]
MNLILFVVCIVLQTQAGLVQAQTTPEKPSGIGTSNAPHSSAFSGNSMSPGTYSSDDNYWEQLGAEGVNGIVYAIVIMGSNIYVGGDFTQAQGMPASNIAMWNGSTWSAVGTGTNGIVRALAVSGTDLYAGGDFSVAGGTSANYIAKWNGASWSALGGGTNDVVRALAVNGSDLYVGGDFNNVDGTNIYSKSTAKWNGSSWTALYNIYVGGRATALAYFDSKLFIGSSNGTLSDWDGSSWGNYSPVLGEDIFAIAFTESGDSRYVGGAFDRYISRDVDSYIGTLNGTVHSIITIGSTMYAAGEFTQFDYDGATTTANHIAKYTGYPTFWSEFGEGVNGTIYALATDGTNIYVGGDFTSGTTGAKISHIGKFNGSTLSPLGTQNANHVDALVASNGSLYASDNRTVKKIEVGSDWPILGSEFSGGLGLSTLAANGNDIYAGGRFGNVGSVYTACIAKWNGSSWSALGDPFTFDEFSDNIYAMAFEGSNLYVGGSFFGYSVYFYNVAQWDGTNWSALGDGLDGTVLSLAVKNGILYAGGSFSGNIAKWNGTSWSTLGTGMNSTVRALAFIGDELYAAGEFSTAGGNPANHIAKWDGTNWSALGAGVDGTVQTLAAAGADLYVGGNFTTAGGTTVNNVAKWDGANWSALGDGANDYINSIAVTGNDLYVGGRFTTIGGITSNRIGHWFKPLAPAAVNKTFTTPQATPLGFNDGENTTGVSVKITTASGGPTISTFRYDDAPTDASMISGDVSSYRWIIQQTGLAAEFDAEVRFKISEIPNNNISDPGEIIIYKRPTPGSGPFTALTTSYDSGTGELVASGVSSFSEFAFGTDETEEQTAIITGNEGWRMMSSPAVAASYATILDTLWTQGFTGTDAPTNGTSNVLTWDEANQQFTSVSNASDLPDAGSGFLVYVFDDQDYDGNADGFPKMIQFDGIQNSETISPTLSYTDTDSIEADGWNLLGNPYSFTIDWNAENGWNKSTLDAAIYVWSDSAGGGNGAYLSWNGTTGTLGNGLIAPWQGFWVKANNENPALSLNDSVRSTGGVFLKKATVPKLRFAISDGRISNETIVMLDEQASKTKDRLDAYKLQSLNKDYLSLFTQLGDGTALDINALPLDLEEALEIALDLDGSDLSGEFELSWNLDA